MNVSNPRRFRFNIRTVLVLVVLAALGIAQWSAMQRLSLVIARNRVLTAEVEKLRTEAGYIDVTDASKVEVLHLRTFDEFTWRWAIHLPEGEWTLHLATSDVPATGFIDGGSATDSLEGTLPVELAVRRGEQNGWIATARVGTTQVERPMRENHALVKSGYFGQSAAGGAGKQERFDPSQPVELLRLRAFNDMSEFAGTETLAPQTTFDGLLVWLTRNPQSVQRAFDR